MSVERMTLEQSKATPDNLLYLALNYLRSLDPVKRTAVIAGVYDNNTNELVVATSHQFRDLNTNLLVWNHAEQEVINALSIKGRINTDSYVFVSSLSTCTRDSSTRAHPSCTHVLVAHGFKHEHVGKIDNNAAKTGLYQRLGFTPILTKDSILLTVCDGLYKFFIPFKKKGWTKERTINAALELLPTQFYIQT